MNTYLTERFEITQSGELITMCGEDVQANSEQEAQQKCPKGFTIIGELLMEIPENNLEADFDNAIHYDEN